MANNDANFHEEAYFPVKCLQLSMDFKWHIGHPSSTFECLLVQTQHFLWFSLYIGQFCLIGSFLVLLITQNYITFLIAMGLTTLGEVIIWPAVPATASRISPAGKEGKYQGIINVFNYIGRLIGPVIGASLYVGSGPFTLIEVMIVFYVVALSTFLLSLSLINPKRTKQSKNATLHTDEQRFH
jgi:MFS family permease